MAVDLMEMPSGAVAIPTGYKALGARTGFEPKPLNDLNLWVAGLKGTGKSTFTGSIPHALVLDWDNGANAVKYRTNVRIPIENIEHWRSIKEKLVADGKANQRQFTHIIFDTVDGYTDSYAATLSEEKGVEAIEEYGQKGAGYAILRRRIMHDIDSLTLAGYSWVLVAHLQEKQITTKSGKEYTALREYLSPKTAQMLQQRATYVLCLGRYTDTEQVTKNLKVGDKVVTRKEDQTVTKFVANIGGEDYDIGAGRIALPKSTIELPEKHGWIEFATLYKQAVTTFLKELGQDSK